MIIKVYCDLTIRCLMRKPWHKLEPKVALSVGKFPQEKIKSLGPCWASSVDMKHPGIDFATEAGLEFDSKEGLNDKEEQEKD